MENVKIINNTHAVNDGVIQDYIGRVTEDNKQYKFDCPIGYIFITKNGNEYTVTFSRQPNWRLD